MQKTASSADITVSVESTPNPATMKFVLSVRILDESVDFATAVETERSPLAAKIFGFPWTSRVFLGPDFVAVTKQDWVDWEILAEPLAGLIREHLQNGEPICYAALEEDASNEEDANDSPLIKNIKRALNNEIRPVVALDGGDIVFGRYEDNKLFIHMRGACAGCPSSTATLKQGIETRLRELFPEIQEVISL
jgi:Fe-S cluster biogenesis protein NfuA